MSAFSTPYLRNESTTGRELRKQSAAKRGELLPGKSDKDGKRKGAKGSQNLDAAEDSGDKICLVCSQLKDIPDWAARNHSTRECGQIARLSKYREDGGQTENPNRYRRDNSNYQKQNHDRFFEDQSYYSPRSVQNPSYETVPH